MDILVVDDDPTLLRLLSDKITRSGHAVHTAADGQAALEMLQKEGAPELAIVDWTMPRLDGLALCQKLRGIESTRYTYVILLTGKATKQDIAAGLLAGADDYLVKPHDPVELEARIKVGERTLAVHRELLRRVSECEDLLRRHDLLGQIVQRHALGGATEQGPAASGEGPGWSEPVAAVAALSRISSTFSGVMASLGLSEVPPPSGSMPNPSDLGFVAWMPIVLERLGVWLDLDLRTDRESAKTLFQTLVGTEPSSDSELLDGLAETLNMAQGPLRTSLQDADLGLLVPSTPQTSLGEVLAPFPTSTRHQRFRICLSGITLLLTVWEHDSPVSEKGLGELKPKDVLARDITSPLDAKQVLLTTNKVLNERFIAKLATLLGKASSKARITVVTPSPIGVLFLKE
ncbi:MAG: response regulator transcription factor [Planctomycetota bacterium]